MALQKFQIYHVATGISPERPFSTPFCPELSRRLLIACLPTGSKLQTNCCVRQAGECLLGVMCCQLMKIADKKCKNSIQPQRLGDILIGSAPFQPRHILHQWAIYSFHSIPFFLLRGAETLQNGFHPCSDVNAYGHSSNSDSRNSQLLRLIFPQSDPLP